MRKVLVNVKDFEILCPEALQYLKDHDCDVILNPLIKTNNATFEEIKPFFKDIEGAIAGNEAWNEACLKECPKLKVISKFGVGIDAFNLEDGKKYKVKMCNCPGTNSNAVAEFAVSLALDAYKRISEQDRKFRDGKWDTYLGDEIRGKTVGLYGFGNVAHFAAKIFKGFGATVIAYDVFLNKELAEQIGVELVSFEDVLKRSDIISIHCPCTPETTHSINAETISMMKDKVVLINTARGPIVETDAVCDALESGKIAWAGLDVFEMEPLPMDSRVRNLKNVTLIPHNAGQTKESWYRISMTAAQNVVNVLDGKDPVAWCNKW